MCFNLTLLHTLQLRCQGSGLEFPTSGKAWTRGASCVTLGRLPGHSESQRVPISEKTQQ